jgi:Mn2+/Fe2+ NRAMP family transporter
MLWVLPLASLLMVSMTMTSMTVGVSLPETPCGAVARRFGRPIAWLVGLAMLVAITMFQASNNNALLMAFEGFLDPAAIGKQNRSAPWVRSAIPLVFNLVIVGILWASRRDLYRVIEKTMALLVGAMVLAFATNLFFAGPSISGVLSGLVPSLPAAASDMDATLAVSWMTTGAMIATTFSVAGAFYQSYQVREKGWRLDDLSLGRFDTVIGICSLGAITMMILITAAAALHGKVDPATLTDASAVARALEPMFGSWARYVFASGVLAGAVSSFVVNALIGAVVFCDAIGKSTKLSSPAVRWMTIVVLGISWAVSALGVLTEIPLADFIVIAQALTVVAFPILAVTIIWQSRQLGDKQLPVWVPAVNYVGLLVVVLLSIRTIARIVGV